MKKRFSVYLVILFACYNFSFSQTALSPGDVAITGFNSDNPDQFSFVILTDIDASTEINFTDNGWVSSGGFRTNEGVLTWTATNDFPCGTEVIVTDDSPFSSTLGSITDDGGFALATNGDEILVYQGIETSPIFIFAIVFDSSGWSDATTAQNTALPVGLSDSINAVNVGEIDNATYNCSVSSNESLILSAVSTSSNWVLSASPVILGTCTYGCSCITTVTWDGSTWIGGLPSINTAVIIDGNYSTANTTSFSACSLTINSGTLIIGNGDYVEVENDVYVANAGGINVSSQGAFVQKNENSTFTNNSSNGVTLTKTKVMQNWYHYTYWSSPMVAESLENVLGVTPLDRRFRYEASNFVDLLSEIDNTGTFNPGPDDIDDNGDDWELMPSGIMLPGIGYATTASTIVGPGGYPNAQSFVFTGSFNNGTINVPLVNISGGVYNDWNFIGNPYPGAISVDDFFAVNTGLVDVIYLWDQATPPSITASGNEGSNFSSDDYAIINGTGQIGARGDTGIEPERYIASGQGFFVEALSVGSVAFTNAMRVTGNNTQFFKSSNAKKTTINNSVDNKIWLNCSSDNGFSNQILIGYNETATKGVDATFYDVPRSLRHSSMMLYSQIEKSNKAFVIQGKNAKDLTPNEKIKLGFSTAISIPTLYKLSIDKLQGEFLTQNTVYLKDRLLKKTYDLSNSDYTFTSEVGEFNDRFEISFKANSSINNRVVTNKVTVLERNNDKLVFSATGDFIIDMISIYDFSGNLIYKLEGNSSQETFELSKLKKSLYIAIVELSSGDIVTNKFIKK